MSNSDRHCCCCQETDDDDESTVVESIGDKWLINPERVALGHKIAVLMEKRREQPAKKPVEDRLLIITIAATTVGIFFSLKAMGYLHLRH